MSASSGPVHELDAGRYHAVMREGVPMIERVDTAGAVRNIESVKHSAPGAVLRDAYDTIIAELPVNEEVSLNTPRRAADALLEMTAGYAVDIKKLCRTFPADGYDEMIFVRGVPFASLCEHHVLPFVGYASVAYLPRNHVIGLSKIPRLVQAFARRLQIQERMTVEIADALVEHLNPLGVMVMIEAEHSCACHRGVRAAGTQMLTNVTRGAMRTNPASRDEALTLLTYKRAA